MTGLIDQPTPEQLVDSLKLPIGYRAELVDRSVVIRPTTYWEHERNIVEISHQLSRNGWLQSQFIGLKTPLGRFVPHLAVTTRAYWELTADEHSRSLEGLVMVVEATTPNESVDRALRRRGYASVTVPLYLLVDRERKETILLREPANGGYAAEDRWPRRADSAAAAVLTHAGGHPLN
jgi:Uma2 family endonuclease